MDLGCFEKICESLTLVKEEASQVAMQIFEYSMKSDCSNVLFAPAAYLFYFFFGRNRKRVVCWFVKCFEPSRL